METLLTVIAVTVGVLLCLSVITLETAWGLGGEFYINGNRGRRKNWIERLFDGFEILGRM